MVPFFIFFILLAKRKASPTKARRAKKPKKNDGIKKPTSAYLYFVSDYRMVLKKKGENISKVQEVAKLCGEAWKNMTDEEKQPYSQKYTTDRARYLKEVSGQMYNVNSSIGLPDNTTNYIDNSYYGIFSYHRLIAYSKKFLPKVAKFEKR